MTKYLDENGLDKVWRLAKDKFVEQVTGKSLSTNDFTDSYKTKIDNIEDIITDEVNSKITNTYIYKGSVQNEGGLPTSGMKSGDVYNIVDKSSYGTAGTNVAWTGTAWDALGGIVEVEALTDAEIDTIFNSVFTS